MYCTSDAQAIPILLQEEDSNDFCGWPDNDRLAKSKSIDGPACLLFVPKQADTHCFAPPIIAESDMHRERTVLKIVMVLLLCDD
jgi:hypothetical protein